MYSDKIEQLIKAALADGVLTDKEKQILFKRAQEEGIDLDEFEMVLDSRLYEHNSPNKNQSITSELPKSNKLGELKKCPACGAIVQSFSAQCSECGFEFRTNETTQSIERLFELLNAVEAKSKDLGGVFGSFKQVIGAGIMNSYGGGDKVTRQKIEIIRTFPLPTTKNDILEFLTLAAPLASSPIPNIFKDPIKFFTRDDTKDHDHLGHVWRAKCIQVVEKAKIALKEDKDTLKQIAEIVKPLDIYL